MFKLLKIFLKNKKTLFLLVGIVLFLSFLPLEPVKAGRDIYCLPDTASYNPVNCLLDDFCPGWDIPGVNIVALTSCGIQYFLSFPIRLGLLGFVMISTVLALVSSQVFSLLAVILNWILAASMSVGITPGNPATPSIVEIGWTFTRDFANMFFLLALALIGLSTILKIKDYEAKKALPTLILIALLINFTPVIVGFLVDMGNILTMFFLSRAGAIFNLSGIMAIIGDYFATSIIGVFLIDGNFFLNFGGVLADFVSIFLYGGVLVIFFFFASYAYIMITLIFLFRIVALWMLMILAPIAFLSRVFSQGKKVQKLFPSILGWEGWWKELIEWIIVGVPMGFFLYLANLMMSSSNVDFIQGVIHSEVLSGASIGSLAVVLTNMIVPTLSLAMLDRGYKISKEAAPAFAKQIYTMGEKAVGMVLGIGKMIAMKGMGKMAGSIAGPMGKGLETIADKQKDIAKRPGAGRVDRILGDLIGKPAAFAGSALSTFAARKRRFKLPEGFDKANRETQLSYINDLGRSKEEKVQLLARMAKSGNLAGAKETDLRKAYDIATSVMQDPHYRGHAEKVLKVMPKEMTEDTLSKLARTETEKFELEGEITRISGEKRIEETMPAEEKERIRIKRDQAASAIFMKRINPEEMARMTASSATDPGVIDGIVRFGKPKHLAKLTEKFGDEFAGTYIEAVKAKAGTDDATSGTQWLIENNPEPLIYMTGHLAQEKGLYIEGLPEKEEIMIEAAKFRKVRIEKRIRKRKEYELPFKEAPEKGVEIMSETTGEIDDFQIIEVTRIKEGLERARVKRKEAEKAVTKERTRRIKRPGRMAKLKRALTLTRRGEEEALARTLPEAKRLAKAADKAERDAGSGVTPAQQTAAVAAVAARDRVEEAERAAKAVEERETRTEAERVAAADRKILKTISEASIGVMKTSPRVIAVERTLTAIAAARDMKLIVGTKETATITTVVEKLVKAVKTEVIKTTETREAVEAQAAAEKIVRDAGLGATPAQKTAVRTAIKRVSRARARATTAVLAKTEATKEALRELKRAITATEKIVRKRKVELAKTEDVGEDPTLAEKEAIGDAFGKQIIAEKVVKVLTKTAEEIKAEAKTAKDKEEEIYSLFEKREFPDDE